MTELQEIGIGKKTYNKHAQVVAEFNFNTNAQYVLVLSDFKQCCSFKVFENAHSCYLQTAQKCLIT